MTVGGKEGFKEGGRLQVIQSLEYQLDLGL